MMRLLWLHEQSTSHQDPVFLISILRLHSQKSWEYVSTTSQCSDVYWASVESSCYLEVSLNSSDMHDWEFWCKLLGHHLTQAALFTSSAVLPSSSLKGESVDVGSILSCLSDASGISLVNDGSLQVHSIEW